MENTIGQVTISADGQPSLVTHYAYLTGTYIFRDERRVPKSVIACQPNMEFHSGWHRTSEVDNVTCAVCRKTAVFTATLTLQVETLCRNRLTSGF